MLLRLTQRWFLIGNTSHIIHWNNADSAIKKIPRVVYLVVLQDDCSKLIGIQKIVWERIILWNSFLERDKYICLPFLPKLDSCSFFFFCFKRDL